jgi:hypothetical protein
VTRLESHLDQTAMDGRNRGSGTGSLEGGRWEEFHAQLDADFDGR